MSAPTFSAILSGHGAIRAGSCPPLLSTARLRLRFRHGCRSSMIHRHQLRAFQIPTHQPDPPVTIPVTPTCPAPSCPCAATPSALRSPDGKPLEINREKNLYDSFPAFDTQLLICSGTTDWPHTRDIYQDVQGSVVPPHLRDANTPGMEKEETLPLSTHLMKRLRGAIHKTRNRSYGLADDRYLPAQVTVLNTSLPSMPSKAPGVVFSAYIMPHNIFLPYIHTLDNQKQWRAIMNLELPPDCLTAEQVVNLLYPQDSTVPDFTCTSYDILILVCGHASQDARCGVYGPLLSREFSTVLERLGYEVEDTSSQATEALDTLSQAKEASDTSSQAKEASDTSSQAKEVSATSAQVTEASDTSSQVTETTDTSSHVTDASDTSSYATNASDKSSQATEAPDTSSQAFETPQGSVPSFHPDRLYGTEVTVKRRPRVRIALTSHVGGHAFAGNVGIWLPNTWTGPDAPASGSIAGHGIWYGRVEPRHVEGIVNETIVHGRVIGELLRGGVDAQGRSLTATKRLTWDGMSDGSTALPAADPFTLHTREADAAPDASLREPPARARADSRRPTVGPTGQPHVITDPWLGLVTDPFKSERQRAREELAEAQKAAAEEQRRQEMQHLEEAKRAERHRRAKQKLEQVPTGSTF